jgi:hypothetical protein
VGGGEEKEITAADAGHGVSIKTIPGNMSHKLREKTHILVKILKTNVFTGASKAFKFSPFSLFLPYLPVIYSSG